MVLTNLGHGAEKVRGASRPIARRFLRMSGARRKGSPLLEGKDTPEQTWWTSEANKAAALSYQLRHVRPLIGQVSVA